MQAAADQTYAHISEAYRREQQRLHENPDYGTASLKYAQTLASILKSANADELLDYGAGKGRLGMALQRLLPNPIRIQHYDPAIPQWSGEPAPSKFVACIDVLEHIEPEQLDNVLDHLRQLVLHKAFFTVHTGPALKILSDGRNAHLVQQPPVWWLERLLSRFDLDVYQRMPNGFAVILERKAG